MPCMIHHLRWLLVSCAVLAAACNTSSTDEVGPGGGGSGSGEGGSGSGEGGSGEGGSGEGGSDGFFSGPIAPACTEELGWCAEVEADAVLSCLDVDRRPYTITTHVAGTSDNVACHVDGGDLGLSVGASQDSADYGIHEVRFWLPGYTGPGTYDLATDPEAGDFRNMGLQLQGVPAGNDNVGDEGVAWATAGWCDALPCTAVVHEGSEPIPGGGDNVEEFRVRVEITCEPDADFWANEGGDCDAIENHCTLEGTPTLRFDVQCSN